MTPVTIWTAAPETVATLHTHRDHTPEPLTPRYYGHIFTLVGEHQMTAVLEAVADPTRRAILERLRVGESCVTNLARQFPISLNSVSKHIKVLERAHLVNREIRGRVHVIHLRAEPLRDAAGWLGQYEAFWEDNLAALETWAVSDHSETSLAASPQDELR